MSALERYQIWISADSHPEQGWIKFGDPRISEASAWRDIHSVALQNWPENASQRRAFENRCMVLPAGEA